MANGGFDLGQVLSRASALADFIEKARRRKLERETPLAGALEEGSRAQQMIGERELEEDPELFRQITSRGAGRHLKPEELEQARGVFAKTPSPARLKRKRDLQESLAKIGVQFAQQRAQNQALSALMAQQFQDQPEMAQLVQGQFAKQETELLNTVMQTMMSAFADLQDDPEVQVLMQRLQQMGIMGGTAPVGPQSMPIRPPAAAPAGRP